VSSPRSAATQPAGCAPEPARAPRVLLVDDNRELCERLAELLSDDAIEVVGTVDRGELALDAIDKADSVDVVVMDVRMPGIGGLEATRVVRHAHPDIAVVLHTAFGGCLNGQVAEVGAFAEVAKGSPPADLTDTIHAAFQAVCAHRAAAVWAGHPQQPDGQRPPDARP
jgi:CheY-like chemotaxis protein